MFWFDLVDASQVVLPSATLKENYEGAAIQDGYFDLVLAFSRGNHLNFAVVVRRLSTDILITPRL